LNAVRNIKQLQSEYIIDANNKVKSVQEIQANQLNAHSNTRKINGGVNTVNVPIQAIVPFMNNRNQRRNMGMFIPQDRPIVTEQDRQKSIISAAVLATIPEATGANPRMYQNTKTHSDMMMSVASQSNTKPVGLGIHGHKRFGMRGLFM
jgi:hypothetical protein